MRLAKGSSLCKYLLERYAITVLRLSQSETEWCGDIVVSTKLTDDIRGGKMLHCTRYTVEASNKMLCRSNEFKTYR